MRFFEDVDGHGEPTIWVEWQNPFATITEPILQRCKVDHRARVEVWPHIVRALTAGPTMESARVVVETLAEENRALHAKIAELDAANADLNGELTDLRRANG